MLEALEANCLQGLELGTVTYCDSEATGAQLFFAAGQPCLGPCRSETSWSPRPAQSSAAQQLSSSAADDGHWIWISPRSDPLGGSCCVRGSPQRHPNVVGAVMIKIFGTTIASIMAIDHNLFLYHHYTLYPCVCVCSHFCDIFVYLSTGLPQDKIIT